LFLPSSSCSLGSVILMSSEVPTLHYFNIRGKAEPIRMLFEEIGLKYNEVRIERDEWINGKKQEYTKKGLALFGQIPILTIGGKTLVQSDAILRYFASQHGFVGETIDERYRCDMLACTCEDFRNTYSRLVYGDFDDKLPDYLKDFLPSLLRTLNTLLMEVDGGEHYFCGKKITYADLVLFELLDINLRLDAQCLDPFASLKAYHGRMASRPRIAAYIASGKRPTKVNNSGKG